MTKKLSKKKQQIKLPRSLHRMFPQVDTAFDADTPIEVSVTNTDCKDAKKLNPSECALARAARRELHADAVIIGMSTSYVIKGKVALRFATPMSVQKEIVSFDRHGDFAPGDYYLTPKSPTAKLGHGGYDKGGRKPRKRKIHHSARVRILPTGQGK